MCGRRRGRRRGAREGACTGASTTPQSPIWRLIRASTPPPPLWPRRVCRVFMKILFRIVVLTLALAGWWWPLRAGAGHGGSGQASGWCRCAAARLWGGRLLADAPPPCGRGAATWGCTRRRLTVVTLPPRSTAPAVTGCRLVAVVSSADGSRAVAGVSQSVRVGLGPVLPCPVPACGRRGRLAGTGSGSHFGVEFGRNMTA